VKRVSLIALSAIFALGLAACDRPGSTDRSAQRSTDQMNTDKSDANKPTPANPTPPTGTPPASKP
jgi:hypothetical protein